MENAHQNEILVFFSKYIETELGIIYAEHNYFQLKNRLDEIIKTLRLPDLNSLYDQAKGGVNEPLKGLILDIATNNETSFFRDKRVFNAIEHIAQHHLPALLGPAESLKIWSAASSTGQEAISLAILFKELNEKTKLFMEPMILATDISERVLEKAKKGIYSSFEVQRGLTPELLHKYFQKSDEDWMASAEIRKWIEFKKLNLKSHFTFPNQFHLILCRNVLIYQNIEGKTDILNRITAHLAPGGYLILGAGESLFGLSRDYEQETIQETFVYKKKGAVALKAA